MTEEVWKDIVGYEGYYQVSNLGRVKGLNRINARKTPLKEMMMKQKINQDGYRSLMLTKNGERKTFLVHRLVAIAFIENEYNKPVVNHIDENKLNNNVNNLNWMTVKENTNWGNGVEKSHITQRKNIYAILEDGTDMYFNSITECAKYFNTGSGGIGNVLNGKRTKHKNMKFEYA